MPQEDKYITRREFDISMKDVKDDIKVLYGKVTKLCENDLPHVQASLIRIEEGISNTHDAIMRHEGEYKELRWAVIILAVLVVAHYFGASAIDAFRMVL